MDDSLLTTRLAPPPRHVGWLARPHLLERLDSLADGNTRLALISAPAGSGKTTLLGQWVAAKAGIQTIRIAWVSLDAGDNLGTEFWSYLMGAVQKVLPDVGQAERKALSLPQAPPVEPLLIRFLNQLAANPLKVVIILDDYHLVTSPGIHAGIAFILDHMPPNLGLLIATRADPPLPLSRLRARGQMAEVRAADLAFTPLESRQFLNGSMGLALGENELDAIARRTEGWAAGVRLAAVALRAHGIDPKLFLDRLAGSPTIMLDYLVDEVLSQQTPGMQHFLLFTSILDELNPSLVEAVCQPEPGTPNGNEMLDALTRANLFIVPIAAEARTFETKIKTFASNDKTPVSGVPFASNDKTPVSGVPFASNDKTPVSGVRYHTLFSEALQSRLAKSYPDVLPQLHRRAGDWYAGNNLLDPALRHYLAAGEKEAAADLIIEHAADYIKCGKNAALLGWLSCLPEAVVASRPGLAVIYARVMTVSGRLKDGAMWADRAEAAITGQLPGVKNLRGRLASVRATIAVMQNQVEETVVQSGLALSCLEPGDAGYAGALLTLGDAALMSSQVDKAIGLLGQAADAGLASGSLNIALLAYAHLAEGYFTLGRLNAVIAVCREAEEAVNNILGSTDLPMHELAQVYSMLGNVLRERDDLVAAEDVLTKAVRLAENSQSMSAEVNAWTGLAGLRLSQGDTSQALMLLDQAIKIIHGRESALFLYSVEAVRAMVWIAAGRLGDARRWADARQVDENGPINYLADFELYSLARLRLAEGQPDAAVRVAQRLSDFALAAGRKGRVLDLTVLMAVACQAAGRVDDADRCLAEALRLAEEGGYVRLFVDEKEPMRVMLERASKISGYARKLLSHFSLPLNTGLGGLIEPLTGRELEVLRLVALGASNQDIATRLVLSIGTVKAHIAHITGKLGARSRTEAVAKAREIGIIE